MPEKGFKTIEIREEVYEKLKERAEQTNRKLPGMIEYLLKTYGNATPFEMTKIECENVIVKVPTNLLRLLEEKNYFGKTKAQFMTYCVNLGVDAYLNELDIAECRRLEDKYGLGEKCGLPTLA